MAGREPLSKIGYAPRGNALIGLDDQNRLMVWKIDCPHPEISFATLFGKIHYEGYAEPAYKWQTTGDEPKFSLVPIIFGTLKSTLYAMCFAVPLALFGAVYVSHFTTPGFKRTIKPIVEIMAAVPSVVIGFLILLWLAPLMGKWLVAVFAGMATLPITFVLFMILWQQIRKFDWAKRLEHGYEFLVLVPVIVIGVILAVWIAHPAEAWLFQGNFKQWFFNVTEKPYDPLNSLVVAFGLGFAIIPIIFSLAGRRVIEHPARSYGRFAGHGGKPLADALADYFAIGQSGNFAAMMIAWPGGRRNDDRVHGHRQHADFGFKSF